VKTTNALKQSQYSAYDPNFGTLIQSTGPNGISTCTALDDLGWPVQEIAHCGSGQDLTTTTARYQRADTSSQFVQVITVTTPPSGAYTMSSTDALGRVVETATRNFSGADSRTSTEYDALGRVNITTKPHFQAETPYQTTMEYDWLGRVTDIYEDLGYLSPGGEFKTSHVKTDYNGSSATTHRYVNGQDLTRQEKKNALGKVSAVIDANATELDFIYDVEGNLSESKTPSNNNKVDILYDLLGRKIKTTDPDLGEWYYTYNGFGDLLTQKDAKSQTTTMTYDVLGRMTTKTDSVTGGTAEWVYDVAVPGSNAGIGKLSAMVSAPDPNLKLPCTILNTTQTSGNRAGRSYTYNQFGDVAQVDECIEGETFTTKYTYNQLGQQSVVTYPAVGGTSFAAQYNYTSLGFLHSVTDASDNSLYWAAKQTNAAGQVTDEVTRNGVETVSTRNNATGWLTGSSTTALADNNTLIQKWTNSFDEAGNLLGRLRAEPSNMADSTETFVYDALERLTSAEVKVSGYDATEGYAYDNIGNLTQKGDKTYTYTGCTTGGGPHAVCTVDNGTAYSYDPNGNMTVGNDHKVSYNPFNKVSHIEGKLNAPGGSSPTVDFVYGADGNRVVQRTGTTAGDETARTVYVGMGGTGKSMYERTTGRLTTEHVHFLYAGGVHGGAFALRVVTEANQDGGGSTSSEPTMAMRYQHFDHLGSVTASTDENGRVVGASGGADTTVFGYDAWGARRNPDGRPATGDLNLQVGHREFTGHETIPGVGLVNMNGRVYDPDLGRFLSPDPNVQFVADLQTYNRYTYAANNPLRYTDPTGYFFGATFDMVIETGIAIVGMVACAYTAGAGCALAFSLMAATYGTASAINNGAGWGNAIGVGLLQLGVGVVAGGFEGGALVGTEASLGSQMLAGACAGAASAAFMTPLSGSGWEGLGKNILTGAASGAAGAALGYAIQSSIVSQASAAEQQGGDREMQTATGSRDQYTKNFKQGTLSDLGGPLNDMDLAGKVGEAWNASNPGPGYESNMSEHGGWIVKNGWFDRLLTGEDYSVEAWPSTSGGSIRPTAEPSDAVAAFHTHPQYELESTPETMNMGSQPGPSPGDIQRRLDVPEYVITNVSVYRLNPNGDVYSLGRSLPRQLGRRRIRAWAKQSGLGIFRDLARDLPELAHPVGAEWEQDVCQPGDVGEEGVTVFLDETTVAEQRLDSGPLVLGGDTRAHPKTRRVPRRTFERDLAKDPLAPEHGDARERAPLAVVGLPGAHPLGEEVGPRAFCEILEALRPGDWQADDLRHRCRRH
jgi:RHS repeat-associated protein